LAKGGRKGWLAKGRGVGPFEEICGVRGGGGIDEKGETKGLSNEGGGGIGDLKSSVTYGEKRPKRGFHQEGGGKLLDYLKGGEG